MKQKITETVNNSKEKPEKIKKTDRRIRFKKGKKKEKELEIKRKKIEYWNEEIEYTEEDVIYFLPVRPEYKVIDEYWVVEPYAKVKIVSIPQLGGQLAYFVEEVKLTPAEKKVVEKLIDILSVEMKPPASIEEDVKNYVIKEAKRLLNKYKKAFRGLTEESWDKIIYYVERDLLGYGPINVMMLDPMLEDISCNGVEKSIYVWHRKYESIPSNVLFLSHDYLREFIIKLAHIAGKHVSTAFPVVDARLPGGHRLAATYGEEISPRGSTFTIRKFREKPFSIIELIEYGTLDTWTAAYLWLMLEHRMTVIVIGGTAAGKTTLLNALLNFVKPAYKLVTIEETPEINIEHENWVQLVSRESYGLGESKTGSIDLYELVRISLRYRPDYIIVGEIRGREAFVLFQAMATGHGGLSTFHADSLENVVRRLMSSPMNVSEPYIPLMNIVVHIERTPLPRGGFARRVKTVWEIKDYDNYIEIIKWNPLTDKYEIVNESYLLTILSLRTGIPLSKLKEEIEDRKRIIEWMIKNKVRDVGDVSKIITKFYMFPEEVKKMAKAVIPSVASPSTNPVVALKKIETGREEVSVAKSAVIEEEATEPKLVTEHPSEVSENEIQEKILKILYDKGKPLDYKTIARHLNIDPLSIWSYIRELNKNKLIKSTVVYSQGAPLVGFELTEKGKKHVEEKGEKH